jgi:hypothetical protein
VIREDRELLAELARLNTAMASLAMRIMDGSASVVEQQNYAHGLIAAGERLWLRAAGMGVAIVEGEVVVDGSLDRPLSLPARTMEPDWEP